MSGKRRFVLFLALCVLGARGASAQPLTEEEALARMLAEHQKLRVFGLEAR